jgi:hypothetical protein
MSVPGERTPVDAGEEDGQGQVKVTGWGTGEKPVMLM